MKRGGAAIVGLAVLIVACGVWWFLLHRTAAWRPALTEREIATRVLAEYLSTRFPGSKALVIANPFSQRPGQSAEISAFDKAGIRGLRTGSKTPDSITVAYPALRPEFDQNPQSVYVDPKTTTPLSFLVAGNAFDALAERNPDSDLIVSLIGLPLNVQNSEVWRSPEKPRFALLLPDWRILGGPETVRQAFKTGKLAAAVVGRPGAPPEDVAPEGDYKAEFGRRFLLVTDENIDELLQTNPKLF